MQIENIILNVEGKDGAYEKRLGTVIVFESFSFWTAPWLFSRSLMPPVSCVDKSKNFKNRFLVKYFCCVVLCFISLDFQIHWWGKKNIALLLRFMKIVRNEYYKYSIHFFILPNFSKAFFPLHKVLWQIFLFWLRIFTSLLEKKKEHHKSW